MWDCYTYSRMVLGAHGIIKDNNRHKKTIYLHYKQFSQRKSDILISHFSGGPGKSTLPTVWLKVSVLFSLPKKLAIGLHP